MTYFITGAGRGIGFELTKQALSLGHQVIGSVRSKSKAKELAALETSSQGRLQIVELDTSSDSSARGLPERLNSQLAIDVLINNAGVYLDKSGEGVASLSIDILQETLDTNTLGPIRVTKALLPHLKRAKAPKIVNITSLMGSIADNKGGGAYAYRVSKTALNMFSKTLAIEFPEWSVLSFHPGWVQTDMGGAGASVSVPESAKGILKNIQELGPAQSGEFFDYKGHKLPW